ncbi:barrier-to-autointegration factor-like [Sparus aurata]|uniref:barrier-to-autointegration factor-like n=1 Tax=Sparus aurata TaxID=8175 RepID=UPI0011C1B1F6|nr:barrier-to-autointegration factor-like [Sparus aurata]
MSSTSKKHDNFVSQPMGEKSVRALPGIGEVLGGRLMTNGFGEASDVLGQYLKLDKDPERFHGWLKETCNANSKQRSDCYDGLEDWCANNL